MTHEQYDRSCCIICNSQLGLACIEKLADLGISIDLIFSDNAELTRWADTRSIRILPVNFSSDPEKYPPSFHLLLSIFNPQILPLSVISLPSLAALNYHNAFLPEYRGFNATAWSIIEGKKQHGFTWHLMNKEIDTGNVVLQSRVDISDQDTAMSLNLKCFEAAVEKLPQAIERLAPTKTSSLVKQTTSLPHKLYLSKHALKGLGLLNFAWPAKKIEQLYRGLSFSDFDNSITTPKIILGNKAYIVDELNVEKSAESFAPGTVVDCDGPLTLSTGTDNITITQLRDLNGTPLLTTSVLTRHQISKGNVLEENLSDTLSYEQATSIITTTDQYWLDILKDSDFRYSGLKELATPQKKQDYLPLTLNTPGEYANSAYYYDVVVLLVFLYKANNYQNVPLFLRTNDSLEQSNPKLDQSYLPICINISPEDTVKNLLQVLQSTISESANHLPLSKDLLCRYQKLAHLDPSSFIYIDISNSKANEKPENFQCLAHFSITHKHTSSITIMGKISESIYAYQDQIYFLANTIIENPESRIRDLSLVSADYFNKRLPKYCGPQVDYSDAINIAEVFSRVVSMHGDRPALIDHKLGQHLTYREADIQSNHIACALQAIVPGNRQPIGMFLCDPLNTILTMLASQKLGQCYVPLVHSYPIEILRDVLIETNIQVVLVDKDLNREYVALLKGLNIKTLPFPSLETLTNNPPSTPFQPQNSSLDSHAYIMYTSGSLGKPKGVIVKQKGILRLVLDTNYIQIQPSDVIAQTSNLSFDAATFTVWGALLNGACLLSLEKNDLLDPNEFKNIATTHGVTITWLSSRILDIHAKRKPSTFAQMKYVLTGGDVVSTNTINRLSQYLKRASSPCKIISAYGPTENTGFTTTYQIDTDTTYQSSIPIGRPITNTAALILDPYGNPVPDGMIGELFVAGDGLAAGYIQPEQTREKFFISNSPTLPYLNQLRLYRTGDLVRWGEQLNFIGRKVGGQVKVRGFRIETQSISSIVECFLGVQKCEILIDKTLEKIIAFVLINDKTNANTIKSLCRENLPDYMVPDNIIPVNQFPLNKNGKLDSARLFSLYKSRVFVHAQRIDYKDEILNKLAEIWIDLLHVEQELDLDANFFDCGGHSLLVMLLLQRVESIFGKTVSIAEFLDNPTVSHLHQVLKSGKSSQLDKKLYKQVKSDIAHCKLEKINTNPVNGDTILLTGVTGFLGSFVLEQLLRNTHYFIYCVTRYPLTFDELVSMKNHLQSLSTKDYLSFEIRVKFILGDIGKPKLGLDTTTYEKVALECREIYHLACNVNHIYSYVQLRKPNVLGTFEILKLANTQHKKKVHFVSTLSAAIADGDFNTYRETHPTTLGAIKNIPDGYSQTQWVSELMIKHAIDLGLEVNIFRPGWIFGSSVSDDLPTSNHLICLLKSCIQLGVAPNWESDLHFLPVDFVASAIVNITSKPYARPNVFNMTNTNGLAWNEIINTVREFGYDIHSVSTQKWRDEYLISLDNKNALFPFKELYLDERHKRTKSPDVSGVIVSNNTLERLHDKGIFMPKIDTDIIRNYLRLLVEIKFLPDPKHSPSASEEPTKLPANDALFSAVDRVVEKHSEEH